MKLLLHSLLCLAVATGLIVGASDEEETIPECPSGIMAALNKCHRSVATIFRAPYKASCVEGGYNTCMCQKLKEISYKCYTAIWRGCKETDALAGLGYADAPDEDAAPFLRYMFLKQAGGSCPPGTFPVKFPGSEYNS